MDSTKNVRWIIPFKKFGLVLCTHLWHFVLKIKPYRSISTHFVRYFILDKNAVIEPHQILLFYYYYRIILKHSCLHYALRKIIFRVLLFFVRVLSERHEEAIITILALKHDTIQANTWDMLPQNQYPSSVSVLNNKMIC